MVLVRQTCRDLCSQWIDLKYLILGDPMDDMSFVVKLIETKGKLKADQGESKKRRQKDIKKKKNN